MGVRGDFYNFILVLHLIAVIAGFGPMMLAGVFGAKAKARGGREGQGIAESQYEVLSTWASGLVYTVPITGIILIMVSEDAWKFSQSWISFSFLLYIVALGLVHAVHRPNLKRMNELMAEMHAGGTEAAGRGGGPPQVAELEQRGKKAAAIGGLLNLIVVLVVVLMVWKPGGV